MVKASAWFLSVLFVVLTLAFFVNCTGSSSSDDDDDTTPIDEVSKTPVEILEGLTGYEWSLSEGDMNVATPSGWKFLFAINLTEEQSRLLDGPWNVDFRAVRNEFAKNGLTFKQSGLDFTQIHNQVVFAKVEQTHGILRLRFTTKLLFSDEVMLIDPEAKEILGGVGGQGFGWYAVYYSTEPFGFLTGEIAPCADDEISRATVTATDSPFFSRPDQDGRFSIPELALNSADPHGLPAAVFIESESCMAVRAATLADTSLYTDPKCEVPGVPEGCSNLTGIKLADGSIIAQPLAVDLPTEGVTPTPADEECANCDFESGDTSGWNSLFTGGEPTPGGCFGVTNAGHGDLFPDSPQSRYAWLTTGGDGLASCTVWRTLVVPEEVSRLEIKYDLATQEYPLWVGSPYTDLFTVVVTGGFGFAVNRTVNNIATGSDFEPIPQSAAAIADIGQSPDASFNSSGRVFNGHLRWASGTNLPRGGPAANNLGAFATWPVTPGETITVIMNVSDIGDPFFDTAALIDYIQFE